MAEEYLKIAKQRIMLYEAFSPIAYNDGKGNLTIGYGQKIDDYDELSEIYGGKPPITEKQFDDVKQTVDV